MLKLKRLRLSAIGRFVDEQVIECTSLGNLIQIDGENRNTNGSSGSGKTTVFNALDYLLGLNDIPTTVLQSRLTKDPIKVSGEFDWDGQDLVIERSKKGLSIEIAGKVIEGSSKLTEEKLDEILGMSRDIFRKILHKRQKEGGFFLEFTPKKMYEFFTDAMNLKEEQKKLEIIEQKLKTLETEKNTRQTTVLTLQSSLKATQESILALGLPPIKDIHQPVILELKGKYDGSTKRFQEVQEKHRLETQELESRRPQTSVQGYDTSKQEQLEARRKELSTRIAELTAAERQRIDSVHSSIRTLTAEQNRLSVIVSEGTRSKTAASEIAAEIKKIRDAICPKCEQSWVTEKAKDEESRLLTALTNHKENIQNAAVASERLKVIGSDLLNFHGQLAPQKHEDEFRINMEIAKIEEELKVEKTNASNHLATQNAANQAVLAKFAAEQAELRLKHSQELDQARGQADVDRRAFEAAVAKLKAYDEAKTRYDNSLTTMKQQEALATEKLAENEARLSAVLAEIAKATELHKIVKSFISCAFDDALEAIGDAATQIIRCIPTMANATIQFEGTKETKDGKVKEEINAVLSMDGDIGIPIKSLSGGERSSVDLAVDLAVIDFVEAKTSKGIDVFILDEPFTGLDTVSIEMALEVLKNSNSNKKLIVVDHNPEVKQLVSNRLVVVREGSTSSITSQEVING